jgi:hypothetical protein
VPRFQINLKDISLKGQVLNEGIRPHWSTVSKDAIGITGGLCVDSSFFNSLVQCHEPILEPWKMTIVVRKQDSDGYLDTLIHGDYMNLNMSTAFLQTIASTLKNIVGVR